MINTENETSLKVNTDTILHYEELKHDNPKSDWLLLIHGAGGSTRTWKKQKEDLNASYHLLIVDLPGHGESKHALYGKCLNDTLKQIYQAVSEIPTILIMGEQDHFFLKQAKKYTAIHKNVQLKVVEKCGHIVNLERGDRFNELCLQFLKSIKVSI